MAAMPFALEVTTSMERTKGDQFWGPSSTCNQHLRLFGRGGHAPDCGGQAGKRGGRSAAGLPKAAEARRRRFSGRPGAYGGVNININKHEYLGASPLYYYGNCRLSALYCISLNPVNICVNLYSETTTGIGADAWNWGTYFLDRFCIYSVHSPGGGRPVGGYKAAVGVVRPV